MRSGDDWTSERYRSSDSWTIALEALALADVADRALGALELAVLEDPDGGQLGREGAAVLAADDETEAQGAASRDRGGRSHDCSAVPIDSSATIAEKCMPVISAAVQPNRSSAVSARNVNRPSASLRQITSGVVCTRPR